LTSSIANKRISSALKPISANKPRLAESSSAEKPTTAAVKKPGKENVVVPARVSKRNADDQVVVHPHAAKRKADEKAIVPLRATKRKADEQTVVPPRVDKRKIDHDEKAVASPLRPTKRTDDKKALTYQERLAQAGRSWVLLEAAAAKKDWHQVIVS
jgi:hypothetical protein